MVDFLDIPTKEITIDKIRNFMNEEGSKRIHFDTTHRNALKKRETGGVVNIPFINSICPIIKAKLGTDKDFYASKGEYGGFYRLLKSDEEYICFEGFVGEYKDIVFLRDNLDISIALSMNYNDDTRTEIGELEYRAKYLNCKESESELVKVCKKWIEKLPYYKNADYICAIPGSDRSNKSLPERIVCLLNGFDFIDISDMVWWESKHRSVKEARDVESKLEILQESNLTVSEDINLTGKTIILFDDLYMSGVSMQFVAMKLKQAGAHRVLGMTVVKSRSNTAL